MSDKADLKATIQQALAEQLKASKLDVVDVLAVPQSGDRIVRLRTLEEALEEFDSAEDGSQAISYLIQIRPAKERKVLQPDELQPLTSLELDGDESATSHGEPSIFSAPVHSPAPASAPGHAAQKTAADQVYLSDGKMNVAYLFRNAELLLESGESTLARNIFKAILQSGERSAMALFGIARCHEAEGKLELACQSYEESIAYQPDLTSYHRLSDAYQRLNKSDHAAAVLERALNLKDLDRPTRFELHKAAGNLWFNSKEAERAQIHFEKALALEPAADAIRSNLGALYLKLGKIREAVRNFEDALASNPSNPKALVGLASCHLAGGDKRAAHDVFARALDLDINQPTAIFHLVKCAYEIRSYATAARIVEEYIEAAPVSASLLYSLAGLQYHLGRTQDAKATVRKVLEISPNHTGAVELLKLLGAQAPSA